MLGVLVPLRAILANKRRLIEGSDSHVTGRTPLRAFVPTAPELPNSLPLTMPTGSSSGRGTMSLEDLLGADHVNESCVLDASPWTIMDG